MRELAICLLILVILDSLRDILVSFYRNKKDGKTVPSIFSMIVVLLSGLAFAIYLILII